MDNKVIPKAKRAILLAMAILSVLFLGMTAEAGDVVYIPDANLEQALKVVFYTEEAITAENMESVKSLDLNEKGIEDLTGLEYAVFLEELDFGNNQVSDLTPLVNLTNLKKLTFSFNQVSDVSMISDLVNLEELDFGRNQVSNLAPLANLTNLTSLYFGGNQVGDLSPLSQLANLEIIWFGYNKIHHIEPLAGLEQLLEIRFPYNQVSDLSPLEGLLNLEGLCMIGNQVNNLDPLVNLLNLKRLWFHENQVSDISPLSSLTNLQRLWFNDNYVYDIASLSNLTSLQQLYIKNNYLDISLGSKDMKLIQQFIKDGVDVDYYPQKEAVINLPPSLSNSLIIGNQAFYLDFLRNLRAQAAKRINEALAADPVNIFVNLPGQFINIRSGQEATAADVAKILDGLQGYYDASGDWIEWEPHPVEIEIKAVRAENGSITVVFTRQLAEYPVLEDFSAWYMSEASVDGEDNSEPIFILAASAGAKGNSWKELGLSALNRDLEKADTVALEFIPFAALAENRIYTLKVSYREGEAITAKPFFVAAAEPLVVEWVEELEDITVPRNTSFTNLDLLAEIEARLSDDTSVKLGIDWSGAEKVYDGRFGSHRLEGELILPEGIVNPFLLKAVVNVRCT